MGWQEEVVFLPAAPEGAGDVGWLKRVSGTSDVTGFGETIWLTTAF